MFEKAKCGITFPEETIANFKDRIVSLSKEMNGAHSVLNFIGLLYDLSLCDDMRVLSSKSFSEEDSESYDSRRINKAYHFMLEHFDKQIKLADSSKRSEHV